MVSFRAKLLTQQHPESLARERHEKFDSPKGIKRKEFEGKDFFTDFTNPEETEVVSEVEENEMTDKDATDHENVNETDTVNQTPLYTIVFQVPVPVQNIVDDPDISKDPKLLDDLSSIIIDVEVRTAFMPHMQKFREPLADAPKSIRKRIENKQ